MKTDIHPDYKEVKITCACGQTFTVGSTSDDDVEVEICSNCHPFYTGVEKTVDTAGRLEKFEARRKAAQSGVKSKAQKKAEKAEKKAEKEAAKNKEA